MLIRRATLLDGTCVDARIAAGEVAELGQGLSAPAGELIQDAAGGALLPGLHDHHLHLFALAALDRSLGCGPPEVRTRDALARVLAGAGGSGWLRGVGYHDSVAGALDRKALDALLPSRPLRIQHRSGALWMLNSAAIERVGLDQGADHPGVERDTDGRATGRLFRADAWLRERLGRSEPPSLAAVGRRLASYGVTGVTDATPSNGAEELAALVRALDGGELLQRVLLMGRPELPESPHESLERGAVKLVLSEHDLPGLETLDSEIRGAHAAGRNVAIHCVTRSELVLATAAFAAAGARAGDRIEHAAVAPPDALAELSELPLTVVTQPGFVRERGDAYLEDVEPRDRPWLYRCRGFLEAGVPLGAGTDAPFGSADPWLAMRAAVDRRSQCGATLGPDERLAPEQALALFTSSPHDPGGPMRRVAPRAPADLLLLDRPWAQARERLCAADVALVLRTGQPIWSREARS